MVFQHFGLLPHRSVLHNIAFGLELQGVKETGAGAAGNGKHATGRTEGLREPDGRRTGREVCSNVYGLARALANDPEVLLMDEAFSALDPLIRIQMQDELLTLQSKMKKTIVFITHDLNEAIKIGATGLLS